MLILNPSLTDCVSVWRGCNAGLLNHIFEVQERHARIRLRLFRLDPCRYFWNMWVVTHQSHLYWKKTISVKKKKKTGWTCTGLPLWQIYMIQGLGLVLSSSYSMYQLQLTAIKLRNSLRSSDVEKFKRNQFHLFMCKLTPESSLSIDNFF